MLHRKRESEWNVRCSIDNWHPPETTRWTQLTWAALNAISPWIKLAPHPPHKMKKGNSSSSVWEPPTTRTSFTSSQKAEQIKVQTKPNNEMRLVFMECNVMERKASSSKTASRSLLGNEDRLLLGQRPVLCCRYAMARRKNEVRSDSTIPFQSNNTSPISDVTAFQNAILMIRLEPLRSWVIPRRIKRMESLYRLC